MGVNFSASARRPDFLYPAGTIVRAKVNLAKAYQPIEGKPDYLGLDRDDVTIKINFQFDCSDGKIGRTVFASWAVPMSEQDNPDACDEQRVTRGERMLFALACAAQGVEVDSPAAERLELGSWEELNGKRVRLKVGQYAALNGKTYQTVDQIMPLQAAPAAQVAHPAQVAQPYAAQPQARPMQAMQAPQAPQMMQAPQFMQPPQQSWGGQTPAQGGWPAYAAPAQGPYQPSLQAAPGQGDDDHIPF